jgi:hypothetical protein
LESANQNQNVKTQTKHLGTIVGVRPHMQQERQLTAEQAAALEQASEQSGFSWQIRTAKAPAETSPQAQRQAWTRLIVAAAKASKRR